MNAIALTHAVRSWRAVMKQLTYTSKYISYVWNLSAMPNRSCVSSWITSEDASTERACLAGLVLALQQYCQDQCLFLNPPQLVKFLNPSHHSFFAYPCIEDQLYIFYFPVFIQVLHFKHVPQSLSTGNLISSAMALGGNFLLDPHEWINVIIVGGHWSWKLEKWISPTLGFLSYIFSLALLQSMMK